MLQSFYGCIRAGKAVHFSNSLRGKIHSSDLKTVPRKFTCIVTASGAGFMQDGFLRLSFAGAEESILPGMEAARRAFASLEG